MVVGLADVIAFLALLVSIYALYQNHKTNQRQARLMEMEIKLNQFLIQKEIRCGCEITSRHEKKNSHKKKQPHGPESSLKWPKL